MTASVGRPAPSFKAQAVVDGEIKEVFLDDYKGRYVVLFFYPLDFSFVCPTEIVAFSEAMDRFEALNGTAVLACSCDSVYSHLAWVNTPRNQGGLGEMKIPILADFTKKIATSYGVLKGEEGTTRVRMNPYCADVPTWKYSNQSVIKPIPPTVGIAFRGLFIIDPQQVVRQVTINDVQVGRSVDETVRLVEAFQFTDKHGEVCPVGWTKGTPAIKPRIAGSKEHF
ncbi:hypothetical protein BGW38_003652 [Lunasporangiospora selenospora]|uniref:Thioredoxin domain-containing protein n=1 Tax=Lunasporangiospora selenospora TaxID=979761 RepID=A0A9P6FSG7_9FUNG|nr:hypothetical protein BGW38_003652 [Lunasporangiospora selenospora]